MTMTRGKAAFGRLLNRTRLKRVFASITLTAQEKRQNAPLTSANSAVLIQLPCLLDTVICVMQLEHLDSDRITSCIDEETGEIVSDVKAYLLKKYDESPDKTMDQLLEDEYDTLRVLLYVGKADGQLRAAEKAEIRETCVTITNDSRLTDETIAELLANMDVPSLQAFKLAVGRLAKKDKASKDIVMVAAERIVATQKTIHSAEQEALDYMKKRFTSEI